MLLTIAVVAVCAPPLAAWGGDIQPPRYEGKILPIEVTLPLQPTAINGTATLRISKSFIDPESGSARETQILGGSLESYQRNDVIRHTVSVTQMEPSQSKSARSFVFSAEYSLDGKHRESWVHGRSVTERRQPPAGNSAAFIDLLLGTFQLLELSQPTADAPLHVRSAIAPIAQLLKRENPATDFYIDGQPAIGRVIGRVVRDGRNGYLLEYKGDERMRSSVVSGIMQVRGYSIVDAATALIVESELHFLTEVTGHRNGYFSRQLEHISSNLQF